MNNKNYDWIKYLLIAFALCVIIGISINSVLALEKIPIKIEIKVSIENNVLRITGENLDWSKSLNLTGNSTIQNISENLELIIIRDFGNISEISNLMDACKNNLNFTDKWQKCLESRLALEIDCIENKINKSNYDNCIANLTEQKNQFDINLVTTKNENENQIKTLTDERDSAQSSKSWLIILVVVLGIGCFYLANKAGLFRRGQTFKEREKPQDFRY